MKLSKKAISSLLCIMLVVSIGLSACDIIVTNETSTAATTGTTQQAAGTQAKETEKDTGKGKTLEISWFDGGNGRGYVDAAIEMYQKMYPDLQILTDIGPQNHETLRPRFISNDPPDIVVANPSFFDYFTVIEEGQLAPLNDVLESPSPDDSSQKLKDMFVGGILDRGKKDGIHYVLPGFIHYYGLWYDEPTFTENGWKVPTNYDEWLEVSEQIKQSGKTAPFTYQGMYPYYLLRTIFFPSVLQYGGIEAFKKINSLEPGAWKQEAVIKTAADIKDYCDKYLMEGTVALNHTQVQMEFINGRAAMITCGTFLENEMKGNWPDSFKLKYTFPPVNKSSDDKIYIVSTSGFRSVAKNGKNPEMAKEFLKLMYGQEMRKVAAETAGAVYPVKDSTKGFEDKVPASVVYANQKISQGNVVAIFCEYEKWYKPLYKVAQDSLTSLITGKFTPEQFAEEVEKEAERLRNDDTVVKYKMH